MRAATAQARTTGNGKFAGDPAHTQAERVLAALVRAKAKGHHPLNKATLLRVAYAGQPVPATGDRAIKQLVSNLRRRGAKITFLTGLGWVLIEPPPADAAVPVAVPPPLPKPVPNRGRPKQSHNAHRIPSHRVCMNCRQRFPTDGQPLYRCKKCKEHDGAEVLEFSMVGTRAWR